MGTIRPRRSPRHRLDERVLAALVGPAAHGYAVTARMRAQSADDGRALDRAEGTVYPVLHRLERSGLVRSGWADVVGRRRRVYELTGAGAAAVERGTVTRTTRRLRPSGLGSLLGWPA